ncbi:MAG TPA: cellulase family glycosylhydrolase [Actinopolymorphaceae bacterium]|nr:cellulase family glycosylhydrolase [Actinopolymorphaceae bacterium]
MGVTRAVKTVATLAALVVSAALVLATPSSAVDAGGPDQRPVQRSQVSAMQQVVDRMQPGWNLGNTFDATPGDETSWGNPRTTRELIAKVADQGFHSIRIPITWDQRTGAAPGYTVDPAFLDRIEQVVTWALDEHMYVIINMHHDSGWVRNMVTDHDAVLAKYSAIWTQVAERFKNYPTTLLFEAINEPRFSDDWNADAPEYFAALNELNTTFHGIVRSSGGNNAQRPLVLSTLTGSPSQARLDQLHQTITALSDPNLIATVHYYGYYPFSVNIAGGTRFDDVAEQDMLDAFDRAYNRFTAEGIPVIVGEYGLLGFDKFVGTIQQGEKLKYFEAIAHYAKVHDFALMLWDNGQHFDRRAYKWNDPDLYAMIKAGFAGRSSTAASDSLYFVNGAPIDDVTVRLNLHGNRLDTIEVGATRLRPGRDFALSGEQLTFKASFLRGVLNGDVGENAVVTAHFSRGADWKFHLIGYETPTLAGAEGTTSGFAVPTQFHGDSLATMEATYPDGSNAGPADWTAYKEFGASFVPSYDTNEIKLTDTFFNEVRDGDVMLRFHFWSGSIVDYKLTKSGSTVTGALLP